MRMLLSAMMACYVVILLSGYSSLSHALPHKAPILDLKAKVIQHRDSLVQLHAEAGDLVLTAADQEVFCMSAYGAHADPTWNDKCVATGPAAVDMSAACQVQYSQMQGAAYTGKPIYAVNTNGNDPKAFECVYTTTDYQHYSLDMVGYCKNSGYSDAWIHGNDVNSWLCHGNKPDRPLSQSDISNICQIQHPGTTARYGNFNDPKSWFCSVQYGVIGGVSVSNYCLSQGYSSSGITNNVWYCSGTRTVNYRKLCQNKGFQYYSQNSGGQYCCTNSLPLT